MSPGSQTPIQRLGRAAIDPVNDGRRGRAHGMVMPVVIPREQECMVLLRLISAHPSSSSGTASTIRFQMVMVVV